MCVNSRLGGHTMPLPSWTPLDCWWQPAQVWVVARRRMSSAAKDEPIAARRVRIVSRNWKPATRV